MFVLYTFWEIYIRLGLIPKVYFYLRILTSFRSCAIDYMRHILTFFFLGTLSGLLDGAHQQVCHMCLTGLLSICLMCSFWYLYINGSLSDMQLPLRKPTIHWQYAWGLFPHPPWILWILLLLTCSSFIPVSTVFHLIRISSWLLLIYTVCTLFWLHLLHDYYIIVQVSVIFWRGGVCAFSLIRNWAVLYRFNCF